MVTDEMVEKAADEMARQDITFANCDRTWQRRTIRAALEAALSAAEPVGELQSVDTKAFDEAIQLLPSVMRPSLSKVIVAAIEEQRQIIAYFKRTSHARQLAFEAVSRQQPAPSVDVKAGREAVAEIRRLHKLLGEHYHGKNGEPNLAIADALEAALSAQVQDVASGVMASIAEERKRQIAKGYDASHDDAHNNYEIIDASWGVAARINIARSFRDQHNISGYKAALIKAAGQIVAEIERLDRAVAPAKQEG